VRRFFLPGGPQRGEALLRGQEREHLARVLRLRLGDEVIVFDGRGREWLARVCGVEPEAARLAILSELEATAERGIEIWLGQALLKGNRTDWLVQKACELGVRRLSFVVSERAVARPPQKEARLERWRRISAAALKQCRGCLMPRIDLLGLEEFLAQPVAGPRFILHEAARCAGLSQAVAEAGSLDRVQLLVGPEGGFSEGEVAQAGKAGFVAVRLGARVLRAETAALAAAAALLYAAGELG
jgi:16S rRNA (uracil1498-N3)-methyltransferase